MSRSWRQAPAAPVALGRGGGGRAGPARIALGVAGLLVVVVPWLVGLLTLAGRRSPGGWLPRRRRAVDPRSRWAATPRPPVPGGVRLARTALGAVVVAGALVASGVGGGIVDRVTGGEPAAGDAYRLTPDEAAVAEGDDEPLPPLDHPVPDDLEASEASSGEEPSVLADEGWYLRSYRTAQGWSFQTDTVWRPTMIYPVLDFRSEGLSVVGGLRPTWQPPTCEGCPTVRLWLYGGSTAYGMNQRDEHTIASELARAAHADGVRLVVENRGVLGYLHWLEAERFAYDLVVDEAPDVVLFYDGANEAWAGNALNNRSSGDLPLPMDPMMSDVWGQGGRSEGAPPPAPPGARAVGWDRGVVLDQRALARTTVQRYDRARTISRALAEQRGVEPLYVWQPTRVSRALVDGEPHWGADEERYTRMQEQLLREYLADDVIDVADALDGDTEPTFTDDVHHDERGARIIAEAIYAKVEGRLRSVLGAG